MSSCSGSLGGRRRRNTKKHSHRRRHRTRRGGFAGASFGGIVDGMNGQPAGAAFTAVGVSGETPYAASNYGGAPSTANGYSGGRRRSRRGRKSRKSRHRMRGGGGTGGGGESGSRIMTSYGGESIGASAPGAAVRGPVYTGSPGV